MHCLIAIWFLEQSQHLLEHDLEYTQSQEVRSYLLTVKFNALSFKRCSSIFWIWIAMNKTYKAIKSILYLYIVLYLVQCNLLRGFDINSEIFVVSLQWYIISMVFTHIQRSSPIPPACGSHTPKGYEYPWLRIPALDSSLHCY